MIKHFSEDFEYSFPASHDEMEKDAIYNLFIACEKELDCRHNIDLTALMGVLPDMLSVIKHKLNENKDRGALGDSHITALKVLLDSCLRK